MQNSLLNLKYIKTTSKVLLVLATILLVLIIIDIKMIFSSKEIGLWDGMPSVIRGSITLGYPLSLLISFILFNWTRQIKAKGDIIAKVLFLMNVLTIVILFVIALN